MNIQSMFRDNIHRPINGVVQVQQATDSILEQELNEYVVTKELKKHFITFFTAFADAFDAPTSDTGVWISGFFGSGKSHLLKMLSYLLANQEVGGVRTVERFRSKFENDPATFMLIDKATHAQIETILFNIDQEGSITKDKTAVLRVFAKMFYNHLGYYGGDLKVAMMEQYIDSLGKTAEFRSVFEAKRGMTWESQRKAFAFNGKYIVPTLVEVLDMSEEDAKAWFNNKKADDFSIAQLVEDIQAYVAKKPKDYRLVFMADEVGQYVGESVDLLLNLQSLVEKIGSVCNGKVWVACTGQEAIDEIIKARQNEFSRIQARFKTRLSLSSSSVDEVIQERVLKKKPEAVTRLEDIYTANDSVLRNLFTFTNARMDIKGFSGPSEFSRNFPFVPYQFIIMQKVFSEIRKHGNAGKHLSGGERSMLSGFQEAAQAICDKNELTIAPLYLFYNSTQGFLDGSIRRVIDRCQKAADNGNGIEQQDVNLLKLLYLIRYVDDIPANLDNLVILQADSITVDKITARDYVRASLERLQRENYIGRTGDTYNFLTDEEQDIEKEIKATPVDTAAIIERIGQLIYGDIYTTKKYRHGKYDFDFDQYVDQTAIGLLRGGMCLTVLTVATDAVEKSALRLANTSQGKAIAVLAETPYYESLEYAMKIKKYVKQRNVAQLAKSVQDIIRGKQEEANAYEVAALEQLRKAIEKAEFYVAGEHIEIRGGDAKARLDQSLEYLVTHVYSELALIEKNYDSDADVVAILNRTTEYLAGTEPNRNAAAKVEEYLQIQRAKRLPTSMADIQSRYQAIPYGWREIDIAAIMAQLIIDEKVTVKYAGATIQAENPKLIDMLRKKSEVGNTIVTSFIHIDVLKMKKVRAFLRDYLDVMDVPDTESDLVKFIIEKFNLQQQHYDSLEARYAGHRYPDHNLLVTAIDLMKDVLSQQRDNIALVDRLLQKQDDLLDSKEDLQRVEDFFKNQVSLFDAAVKFEADLRNDREYIEKDDAANKALGQIRIVTGMAGGKFDYKRIPELNELMAAVRESHDRMLDEKRRELNSIIMQCRGTLHQMVEFLTSSTRPIIEKADNYYDQRKADVQAQTCIALLDGMVPNLWNYMEGAKANLEIAMRPPEPPKPVSPVTPAQPPKPQKHYRTVYRQAVFATKKLESEADIDAYLENIRKLLKQQLNSFDGIDIK